MKKKIGRPKRAKNKAKGIIFAARFDKEEARILRKAIKKSKRVKSVWIREKLMAAAIAQT